MVENNPPQSNPGAIEALKAATRQVVQPTPGSEPKQKLESMPASETFADAFVRKITSVEQEKAKIEKEQLVVEQELDRVGKLQSGLIERKKQLDNRRNELTTVKDKLKELD